MVYPIIQENLSLKHINEVEAVRVECGLKTDTSIPLDAMTIFRNLAKYL